MAAREGITVRSLGRVIGTHTRATLPRSTLSHPLPSCHSPPRPPSHLATHSSRPSRVTPPPHPTQTTVSFLWHLAQFAAPQAFAPAALGTATAKQQTRHSPSPTVWCTKSRWCRGTQRKFAIWVGPNTATHFEYAPGKAKWTSSTTWSPVLPSIMPVQLQNAVVSNLWQGGRVAGWQWRSGGKTRLGAELPRMRRRAERPQEHKNTPMRNVSCSSRVSLTRHDERSPDELVEADFGAEGWCKHDPIRAGWWR